MLKEELKMLCVIYTGEMVQNFLYVVEEEGEEEENDQFSVKFTHPVLVQKKMFFCYASYDTCNLTLPPLHIIKTSLL